MTPSEENEQFHQNQTARNLPRIRRRLLLKNGGRRETRESQASGASMPAACQLHGLHGIARPRSLRRTQQIAGAVHHCIVKQLLHCGCVQNHCPKHCLLVKDTTAAKQSCSRACETTAPEHCILLKDTAAARHGCVCAGHSSPQQPRHLRRAGSRGHWARRT